VAFPNLLGKLRVGVLELAFCFLSGRSNSNSTHDTSAHENEVSTDYREYEEHVREMFSTHQSSLLSISLV
jgi:hypothetical protein